MGGLGTLTAHVPSAVGGLRGVPVARRRPQGDTAVKLAGRVAIVTGSSMGIGEAIGAAFLREGARLVVNSRDQRRADAAVARLGKAGETLALAADVATREGVERLVDGAVQRWGRLDVMVN